MTEQQNLYCTCCGAKNPLTLEVCATCGAELNRPHPIQLAGGEIYTLRCAGCGERLPVVKTQGTVTCAVCGTTHAIVSGPGYLTVKSTPGINGSTDDGEYRLEKIVVEKKQPAVQEKPVELPPEIPAHLREQMQRQAQLKSLESSRDLKQRELKKRKARRIRSRIAMIVGVLAFILMVLTVNLDFFEAEIIPPLLFIGSIASFFTGLILLIITGKKKDRKIQSEIDLMSGEITSLEKTVAAEGTAGGEK